MSPGFELMGWLPFFVYGTLLQDEANHHLLKRVTLSCRPALLHGAVMYDLGPYPMLIEAEGVIIGELVEINPTQYEATLARLDILEGVNGQMPEHPDGLYRRVRRLIHLPEEPETLPIEAWVYLGQEKTARRGLLRPKGDWRRRFSETEN